MLVLGFLSIGAISCVPTCIPEFTEPSNLTPLDHSMIGTLNPTLTWDYPETHCPSEEFYVRLYTNATNGTISLTSLGGATGSPDHDWTTPNLTTGVAYIWDVAAKNGTLIGPPSFGWNFFVGPVCQTLDLVAPVPVEPIGSSPFAPLDPTYIWSYPDPACAPEGYHLQVSELSDFSSLTVNVRETDNPYQAWTTGVTLDDCTDYYWRVAAVHDTDDGPWSTAAHFHTDAFGTCVCLVAELDSPTIIAPLQYEIVPDLLPMLEWTYPGTCEVEGYGIHLSPDFDFVDETYFGGTGSPATSWLPGDDLEPATQYHARVFAGVGTDFGPYSNHRSFFTGPECTTIDQVVAPELLSPPNGEIITDPSAFLHWTPGDPGCIPDGYFVDLQTAADFSLSTELAEYDIPATNVITEPLVDCETYYWRVAAVQDDTYGPYSATGWFRTNISGDCLFPYFPGWVLQNINCRICGDPICPIMHIFEEGMIARVLGRSVDNAYLKLEDPDGGVCYSASFAFDVPLEELEMVRLPPTPTPVPVCSRDIDNEKDCKAAGGKWVLNPKTLTAAIYYCECGD